VTPRSASRKATDFDVIDDPRSAWILSVSSVMSNFRHVSAMRRLGFGKYVLLVVSRECTPPSPWQALQCQSCGWAPTLATRAPLDQPGFLQRQRRHDPRIAEPEIVPLAPIVQPALVVLLVLLPPAPHGAVRSPDDLGCFPPFQLAFRITCCIFIIRSISYPLGRRTFHLLIGPDNSHATDNQFLQCATNGRVPR
jgi:hypothetical protein